jgi:hypothetical protein
VYLIRIVKILKFCEIHKIQHAQNLKTQSQQGLQGIKLIDTYKKLTKNLHIINLIKDLTPQKIKTYPAPINVIKISNT